MKFKVKFGKRATALLERIAAAIEAPQAGEAKLFLSSLTVEGLTVTGEIMAFQLTDSGPGSTARATVTALSAAGNPATVENPVWSSSDPSVMVIDSADGLTCDFRAAGNLGGGTVQLQFQCDADLGSGVRALSGFAEIEVISGEAASLTFDLSAIPPAVPAP